MRGDGDVRGKRRHEQREGTERPDQSAVSFDLFSAEQETDPKTLAKCGLLVISRLA
jgi:hypothetical protein